jgi:hypothetical protein
MRENQFGFGLDTVHRGDIATMPAVFFPGDVNVSHGDSSAWIRGDGDSVGHAHTERPRFPATKRYGEG